MESKIATPASPQPPNDVERNQENPTSTPPEIRKEAHRLLDLGYTPLPAVPEKKRPPFPWKQYQTTPPTHDELDQIFDQYPSASGLGIITTGLVIIDVDALADGAQNPFPENSNLRKVLLAAPVVDTPGGGTHYYFRSVPNLVVKNSASVIAPRVDVRASGGFLMVPPTSRAEKPYAWRGSKPIDVPPGKLPIVPDFIIETVTKTKPSQKPHQKPTTGAILEGTRDDTLFRLACKWCGQGHKESAILALLRVTNHENCQPPLDDPQLVKIAGSASKYEPNQLPEPIVEHPDPGPIPDRLFRVPGFISQVMELTLTSAPRPNKPLAFAGALALLATLAGRKVRTESDLRTNIYLICIGASGVGKDHPRKVIKSVLFDIGMGDSIIGSIASGQALEDEIAKTPSCLAMTDEMDELLMAIRRDKSGTRQNLPKVMMELFTSAAGPYQTRAKVDHYRSHISQPNFCLFGTAVPERFYESISARMMDDGFLGRSLVIEAGKLGPRQHSGIIEIPPSIRKTTRYWADYTIHHQWNKEKPCPTIVHPTAEAEAILEQAADDFDEVRNQAQDAGDNSSVSIWARTWEHASKLALLYAISENHNDPTITPAAAKWAIEFAGHHAKRLIATIHGRVSENEFHALLIKAKTKLSASPRKTMSRSRLMKNMHISARDLDQVITVLTEGGEVEVVQGDPMSPNQRGSFYRLVSE